MEDLGVVVIMENFYNGKRVFVTGYTGFKGSWLCEILLNFGAEVCGYALEPDELSLFNILNLKDRVKNNFADIRDLKSLKQAVKDFEPEIILHLAAQPIVLASYEDPVYTYETNVMGTVNILETARECKALKSFVNITTDKVYENKEWPWGYREHENLCGFDPYSNSKSCSELVTYSYKHAFFKDESSPAVSTARAGNVVGGGDFSANRIIPDCVRAALKGDKIFLRNPNSIRPYQHVLDCLNGYLILAMKQYEDKNFAGNYNFGPDESDCVTTEFLAKNFCASWGENLNYEANINLNAPHEANILKLDCSLAKSILGWRPNWNVAKAISSIVEWTKSWRENNLQAKNCMDGQIKEFFNL